jgi:uncharacterized alpha-E superfamily protein
MLSSVAEKVYWLGRYMERVENSARLMDVYSSMLLDLPRGSNISWDLLLDITGSTEKFAASHSTVSETLVVRYLLAELDNSSSMISSLRALRENARTTREVIPSEAWEHINKMYFYAKDVIESGIGRKVRRELFTELIADCQSLGGMLSGTMAHNTAYTFIQLGRGLERADMTSRIVDVGSISLIPAFADSSREEESLEEVYKNVVWMNVLRSVSGYQAYRQNVANRVQGEGVVRFLLQDDEFPRAIVFLLEFINTNLERLPNHDDVQLAIVRVKRITSEANVFHLLENGLLEFIDELQISFGDVHNEMSKTWFGYEDVESEDNPVVAEIKPFIAPEKAKAKSNKTKKQVTRKVNRKIKRKVKKKVVKKAKGKPKVGAKTKLSVSTKSKTKKSKASKTKKKNVKNKKR